MSQKFFKFDSARYELSTVQNENYKGIVGWFYIVNKGTGELIKFDDLEEPFIEFEGFVYSVRNSKLFFVGISDYGDLEGVSVAVFNKDSIL